MKVIDGFFTKFADMLWGNWMLYLLLGLGVFYTLVTGCIQIRSIPWIVREFKETGKRKKDGNSGETEGSLSSVQALCTAIASCVGSGNIVGVATALIAGGPGALFWMWLAAFFGMATKYGEIVLGLNYRIKTEEGMCQGGPMYYIARGLHAPWLGVAAAVLLFIQNAGATLIQSNTISSVMQDIAHVPKPVTGVLLACIMSFIIRGGLKRLAHVAQRIVPVMAGIYILGGAAVILVNADSFLPMLSAILRGAFSLEAGLGAAAGVTMKEAMRFGVARGLYSNEAGEGSAAVIHSSANVDHPSRQGFYGVVEVFVDTMIICSTTGFAILSSGVSLEGASAASLAASAFGTVFPAFGSVVSISLVLFAATSIMGQWYFGHVSLGYIKSKRGDMLYRFLFPVLILCGSLSTVSMVWAIQDCMLGLLVIPNVAALVVMSPEVSGATKEFFNKERESWMRR